MMHNAGLLFFLLVMLCRTDCAPAFADAPPISKEGTEFFETKVRPLLANNCYECHSAAAKSVKSAFVLDSRDGLLKGGESGKPALVAGQPEASRLIAAVKRVDPKFSMPPNEAKKLTSEQIGDLEAWIKMGAPDPRTVAAPLPLTNAEKAKAHWAFKKPIEPPVPAVKNQGWVKTPIDSFILAKLEEQGFAPSAAAAKGVLIRRATFDLTGLPPTPDEVDAFQADNAPNAFTKVVDRLLASPRYGERWGRYWLDVARYADTKGYVFEEERRYPFSFTYRDWVIRAFNEDLAYDQFLIQQIAADRLPLGNDNRPLAAEGFLTVGRRFLNSLPDIIDDRIDVVCRGTMGLTVGCARCHDHKFDPIPTADYYSLYGIFASSIESKDPPTIATPADDANAKAFEAEFAKRQSDLQAYLSKRQAEIIAKLRSAKGIADYLLAAREAKGVAPDALRSVVQAHDVNGFLLGRWRALLDGAANAHDPVLSAYEQFAAIAPSEFAAKSAAVTDAIVRNADPQKPLNSIIVGAFAGRAPPASMGEVCDRLGEVIAAADKPDAQTDPNLEAVRLILRGDKSPTAVAVGEIKSAFGRDDLNRVRDLQKRIDELEATHPGSPPRAMSMEDAPQPVTPHIFLRGNSGNVGPEVPRQFLAVAAGENRKPFVNGSGRLEMAQAIASKDNPLTARVMVNRIWLNHFGQGLVRTPSDFGLRSDPPTHPELLDWLAVQFMKDGWSIKKLHRQIMLSAVYQQDSTGNPAYVAADVQNLYLSHFNRRRLDFEAMRDALLFVTGHIDLTMGGKGVELTTEPFTSRRTVYGFIERQNLPGLFRTFDFASPDQTSPQRFFTTVPQQALFMMNSPFLVQQVRELTARDGVASEPDQPKRVGALYRLLFGRSPNAEEVAAAAEFVKGELLQQPPHAAWTYGYGQYDPGTQRVIHFEKLPHFAGSAWQGGVKVPDAKLGWLTLNANAGHPGVGPEHNAIRRWTSPLDGTVSIDGQLRHDSPDGNGVQGRIVSSRSGELASWAVHASLAQTKLDQIAVKSGDTIDFAVDSRGDDSFDSFAWAPVIRLTRPQIATGAGSEGVSEWDAAANFAGPSGTPGLTPWEKYVQILMESNEFMFVD